VFLVIFGAGASYDSVPEASRTAPPDDPLRPPLAKDLFDPGRPPFVEAVYEYHEGAGLIGEIRSLVRFGTGVEIALERYVEDAGGGDPETIRGLLAVRYYIVRVINECALNWSRRHGNVTNYRILFNQLERWRRSNDDKGLLVTFNYDRLLEEALRSSGRQLNDIQDYVSRDDYRLIKPHGSTSWLRGVDTEVSGGEHALIDVAPSLDLSSGPIARGAPRGYQNVVPAIAIPTQTKTTFECPPEHLAALEEWLPEVDRFLVIGWRAQERHFLDLCEKHLANKTGIEGLIVSSSQDGAQATVMELQRVLPKACLHPSAATGFSPFVDSDDPVTTWLERRLHRWLDRDDPSHRTVRGV
jgi:hypothetical protein